MTTFGLMVVKDELYRYYSSSLNDLKDKVDQVFVFDDDSTDGTWEYTQLLPIHSCRKSPSTPSLVEDEGEFRSAAFREFERRLHPQVGDTVVVLDADEMLRGDLKDLPDGDAFSLHVYEAFDYNALSDEFMIRIDGWWGKIDSPRVFRWDGSTQVRRQKMGSGSIPAHLFKSAVKTDALQILHCGYMTQKDREDKYFRYTEHSRGHSSLHVSSILREPMLVPLSHLMNRD